MAGTTATLSASALKKAIDRYYHELHEYQGKADYELAVRTAFLNLLAETARQVKWTLIPEQTIEGNIRPDAGRGTARVLLLLSVGQPFGA